MNGWTVGELTRVRLRVATANVDTARSPGRIEDFCWTWSKEGLNSVVLQETKLEEDGGVVVGDWIIYRGGKMADGSSWRSGVPLALRRRLAGAVISVGRIGNRLMVARFGTGLYDLVVVVVHAPHQGGPLDERSKYFDNLYNMRNISISV